MVRRKITLPRGRCTDQTRLLWTAKWLFRHMKTPSQRGTAHELEKLEEFHGISCVRRCLFCKLNVQNLKKEHWAGRVDNDMQNRTAILKLCEAVSRYIAGQILKQCIRFPVLQCFAYSSLPKGPPGSCEDHCFQSIWNNRRKIQSKPHSVVQRFVVH